jgi:hypothetical protein
MDTDSLSRKVSNKSLFNTFFILHVHKYLEIKKMYNRVSLGNVYDGTVPIIIIITSCQLATK